jgi:predicted amidohydrolase
VTVLDPLTLAVAQPRCVPRDVAANARAHADAIRAAGARVVVFPELSLTGYELDVAPVSPGDPELAPIIEACAATRSRALVGAPVSGAHGTRHIATLAVDGDGASVAYRKMWLHGAEAEHYLAGTEPSVLTVDGWRLGLAICRDTGIAEHAADTARLGIDAYVAGVVEAAQDAAVPARRAKRISADHGVWVAIASAAGAAGTDYRDSPGGSGVWRPDGSPAAAAGPEPGAVARATLK